MVDSGIRHQTGTFMPDHRPFTAVLHMYTPVLGEHLTTLRGLIEYACCCHLGDAGMQVAADILPVGGQLTPSSREGSGVIQLTSKIGMEYFKLDADRISEKPKKDTKQFSDARGNKRNLKIENIMNTYRWYYYPRLIARGVGDLDAVNFYLGRIGSVGMRRNAGWGWVSDYEIIPDPVGETA